MLHFTPWMSIIELNWSEVLHPDSDQSNRVCFPIVIFTCSHPHSPQYSRIHQDFKEPNIDQLFIFLSSIGADAIQDLHSKMLDRWTAVMHGLPDFAVHTQWEPLVKGSNNGSNKFMNNPWMSLEVCKDGMGEAGGWSDRVAGWLLPACHISCLAFWATHFPWFLLISKEASYTMWMHPYLNCGRACRHGSPWWPRHCTKPNEYGKTGAKCLPVQWATWWNGVGLSDLRRQGLQNLQGSWSTLFNGTVKWVFGAIVINVGE